MGAKTHVLRFGGGSTTLEVDAALDRGMFSSPLRGFDGDQRWALTLLPLPAGVRNYNAALAGGHVFDHYLQAAGRADALTVEIRKPGGEQWGARSVRYVVGHSNAVNQPLDVAIRLPVSTQIIRAGEVFTAEEAADIFYRYYRSGDIAPEYTLRPVEG